MTWLRIDDGMVDHRKWAALEEDPRVWAECLAVWVALASYCQRTLSDGHVPDARVSRLTPLGARAKTRCDDMVRVGLMERVSDGYVFHDWLVYQSSRRQVEEQREQKTRRQQRWRDGRVDASTSRLGDGPRDAPVEPAPSHPIPSHPTPPSGESDARAPVRAAPMSAERADLDAFESRCERVRQAIDRECRAVRGAPPPPSCTLQGPEVTTIARWLATAGDVDIEAMARRWAGARDRAGKWAPLRWLANDPSEFAFPGPAKGGHAAPRKAHEYEARSMTFDELMREREAALGGGSHG